MIPSISMATERIRDKDGSGGKIGRGFGGVVFSLPGMPGESVAELPSLASLSAAEGGVCGFTGPFSAGFDFLFFLGFDIGLGLGKRKIKLMNQNSGLTVWQNRTLLPEYLWLIVDDRPLKTGFAAHFIQQQKRGDRVE